MKETVLVTGGAGYIGSHTAVELIQAGFDVVIADNLSNSDLQAVEGVRRITGAEVPFEQIDCCDLQAMRRLFERHEFRSVIHFAASKAVGESVAEPLKYYRNNLLSFLNVVELMCDFGRPNILFSSSCTVYGEPDAQPVTEQTPRKPATSPYGNTKQISEDILRDAVAAHPGLRERMQKWIDTGVLVVENESGLLFTYGHLLGLRTASICVALGSMFADPNANVYGAYADPEHLARRIETATRIAMRAAELLEGSK